MSNLCIALGWGDIDELTEEQVLTLDAALKEGSEAAQKALLPPSDEPESSSLTPAQTAAMQETQKVINAVGETTLIRNMALFIRQDIENMQKLSQTRAIVLKRFEQEIYNQTNATLNKITNDMESIYSRATDDIQKIITATTPDSENPYDDYLKAVNEYLTDLNQK